MKLKNYIAHAVAAVTNGSVSLVGGLLVIWLLGQSPAGAATIPKYLKLNPKGVVPTLVHDGKAIIEFYANLRVSR